MDDLLLEEALQAVSPESEVVVTKPREGPQSRVGNTIFVGERAVGSMSYLLHWEPATYSAKCKVHEGCVCTGHVGRIQESELEAWLADAPRYLSARDHMLRKPQGAYNRMDG